MTKLKDQMLALVKADARRRLADLSNRYIQAQPSERETIQAAIEVERWLAQGCDDCLE
jgi:hypothetical protein